MKKFFTSLAVSCFALCMPYEALAQVSATIIEQDITPAVMDLDNDREYVSVSYTIKVTGAEGHTLRVEAPWLNVNKKAVYTNIDEGEKAMSNDSYTINLDTDTIEGWCGTYHDSFWLRPGLHKLNTTLRLFDETLGKYIPLTGAKMLTFSYTSQKKPQGVVFTSHYLEHNKYVDGQKVMYVRYEFETNWLRNKQLRCEVALYKANGTPLYTNQGKHHKNVWNPTPTYTFSTYSDRWAWFSYSAMRMPKGKTNCYAIIRIYDAKTGTVLGKSPKLEFTFTR